MSNIVALDRLSRPTANTTVSTTGRGPNADPWVTSIFSGRSPALDSASALCPRVVAYTSSPASRQHRATRSPRYPQPTTSLRTLPSTSSNPWQ